jgi:hypothetical protein
VVKHLSIGVDPGLLEGGAVAFDDLDEFTPLAWAVWSCAATDDPDMAKVLAMADQVVDAILQWATGLEAQRLDVSIELPIAKKDQFFNPRTFAKQVRLIQEIESGIYYRVASEVVECFMTEVYPNTSKKMATNHGGASKAEVLAASPFSSLKAPMGSKKTLADAWSHGLSTWPGKSGKVAARMNFTQMKMSEVRYRGFTSPR